MTDEKHQKKNYTRHRKNSIEEIDDQISRFSDSLSNFITEEIDRVLSCDESMIGVLEEYSCPKETRTSIHTIIDNNLNSYESSKTIGWLNFINPFIFTTILILIGVYIKKKLTRLSIFK